MAPNKTERGRAALLAHAQSGLSLAERRVLILCDGRRRREDIVALLGPAALPMLDRLVADRYLSADEDAPGSPEAPAAPPAPASTMAAPAPKPASRRSLAASKMYLLDMLQLQRDPESVSLRAEIQTSPSEDELVYRLMKALLHLQAVAAEGYARRVGERLAEILPEPHLPRLEQVRMTAPDSTSAAA